MIILVTPVAGLAEPGNGPTLVNTDRVLAAYGANSGDHTQLLFDVNATNSTDSMEIDLPFATYQALVGMVDMTS